MMAEHDIQQHKKRPNTAQPLDFDNERPRPIYTKERLMLSTE